MPAKVLDEAVGRVHWPFRINSATLIEEGNPRLYVACVLYLSMDLPRWNHGLNQKEVFRPLPMRKLQPFNIHSLAIHFLFRLHEALYLNLTSHIDFFLLRKHAQLACKDCKVILEESLTTRHKTTVLDVCIRSG